MRRLLLSVVLLLAALVLQLTVLDRLPLPGGVAPDLVLLVVVALSLSGGPLAGAIGGFCAGLALDVAPPSDHLIGMYALVFCLVGYFCGMVSAELDRSVLLPLAAAALGAAGGAGLYAGAGIVFGLPDVTGSAVRHVLPLSVLYDVLLSPFVLYAVALCFRVGAARRARLAGAAGPARPSGDAIAAQLPGARPSATRRRVPRLRLAAASPRDGWISGGGWLAASAELARRQPATVRLHLGGVRTAAVPARSASTGTGVPRLRFSSGRRGDAVLGGRLPGGGLATDFAGGGRVTPGPSRGPRLFTRRGWLRPGGTGAIRWAGFVRKPSWGPRAAGGAGSAPRRGAFGKSTSRKNRGSPAAAPQRALRALRALRAAPRRGTFGPGSLRRRRTGAGPPRGALSAGSPRRALSSGSPRRGSFSGGSSTPGSLGSGSPRRGAFGGGPRRLRALRRATLRGGARGPGTSVLGRVRGGRSTAPRFTRKPARGLGAALGHKLGRNLGHKLGRNLGHKLGRGRTGGYR
jgi:rod shape-determining protein MreD